MSPSLYLTDVSFNSVYIINSYIVRENDSKVISNRSIIPCSIEQYEDKLYSDLSDYQITEIHTEKSSDGAIYAIEARIDDAIYHITIIISTVGGRLEGRDVLENEKRRRVFEYVQMNPGVYFRQIMKSHNLSPNETQYHLATLERHGLITRHNLGRYHLYHANNSDLVESLMIRHLITSSDHFIKIYELYASNPDLTNRAISKQTGLHRNTISKYMRIIEDCYEV
jgi:DNA-binding transcriptional ArsR family regulator